MVSLKRIDMMRLECVWVRGEAAWLAVHFRSALNGNALEALRQFNYQGRAEMRGFVGTPGEVCALKGAAGRGE